MNRRILSCRFIESLLSYFIKCCPQSLPDLYFHAGQGSSNINQPNNLGNVEKDKNKTKNDNVSPSNKRKHRKNSKKSNLFDPNDRLRQPTIIDVLRKTGHLTTPDMQNEESTSTILEGRTSESTDHSSSDFNGPASIEVSAVAKPLETQRFKFRPLQFECLSLLTFSKVCGRNF